MVKIHVVTEYIQDFLPNTKCTDLYIYFIQNFGGSRNDFDRGNHRKKERKEKKKREYLRPEERGRTDSRYLSESRFPPSENCPKTFLSELSEMTKLVSQSNP